MPKKLLDNCGSRIDASRTVIMHYWILRYRTVKAIYVL